jgi:hypothetical protein
MDRMRHAGIWATAPRSLSRRKVLELAEAARPIEQEFVHRIRAL